MIPGTAPPQWVNGSQPIQKEQAANLARYLNRLGPDLGSDHLPVEATMTAGR